MGQVGRPPFLPKEFRGWALNSAATLETSCPGFILRLLYASNLSRQVFFAVAAEGNLDQPEAFLARIAKRAPDVTADIAHLESGIAQIGRALTLLKPQRALECLYGSCPNGLLGLFGRFGSQPLYGAETYRLAFELFSRPENRHRAKVLGQLAGQVRPEHLLVVAGLADVLVHRATAERVRRSEVQALNSFATMIADLCDATPLAIKQSLDTLAVGTQGVKMTEWVQNWLARQVRLPVDPPIPASDPDFRLRIGGEMSSLGRRLRNCAGQRLGFAFVGDRLLYEWNRDGEQAVIELARLSSGSEVKWYCTDALRARNRRINPVVAVAIQEKLDEYGILYEPLMLRPSPQKPLHDLIDYYVRPAWDEAFDATREAGDDPLDKMLDELEEEIHGQEAA
uniref:Uncharacterized protein n=1 Tax=Bosea sp. NBC_00436 TaxID=2969620 RepID=A0A9E7ZRK2_9HYPH